MPEPPKTISIVTPCYNEEGNVQEVYERVRTLMEELGYPYEHVFIDNASRDDTRRHLLSLAARDRNVKLIFNTRNFGHIRSPMHALLEARGSAVILLFSDLQDPPELLRELIREWESGTPVVIAIKNTSDESRIMFWIRKNYYELLDRLSAIETYQNFTGFGLYDRKVIEMLRRFHDPYPYLRGMIAELGFPRAEIEYNQKRRKRGITKNNFYTLYDMAMLGITNLSKIPLRMVTFSGFLGSMLSVLIGISYLVYKIVFWDRFSVGIAPLVIGIFFLGSLQLLFIGVIGEYIGAIHTLVQGRPLVIEGDRLNFEYPPDFALRTAVNTEAR